MSRVLFYSDESYGKGASPSIAIAGIAIEDYHNVIWQGLLKAEENSGKTTKDWRKTRDRKQRRNYLEMALGIPYLTGRVFYRVFDTPQNRWMARIEALSAAANQFAPDKPTVIYQEGFTKANRALLKLDLEREGVNVEEARPGSVVENPMIRLADSLAGFFRLMRTNPLGGNPDPRDYFGHLMYDWFVELQA